MQTEIDLGFGAQCSNDDSNKNNNKENDCYYSHKIIPVYYRPEMQAMRETDERTCPAPAS